jgi:hypothetical protein
MTRWGDWNQEEGGGQSLVVESLEEEHLVCQLHRQQLTCRVDSAFSIHSVSTLML